MYTKPKYAVRDVILWTRWEIFGFFLVALIPVLLYHYLGLKWLQLPWTPVALIGTAVAFLIGFQNNASYERIWEARKIWGGIVNETRTLGTMVRDMITNEYADEPASEEELASHRKTLLDRHFAWLTALRHAMRSPKPWEYSGRHATNREWENSICIPERHRSLEDELRGLLSQAEFEGVMAKDNKATALLYLQSSHLRSLKEKKLLWEFSFLEMQGLMRQLFELQGKSERIKNFPYPRQYATLGCDFIRVFVLMLPFAMLPEFDKLGQELMNKFPLIAPHLPGWPCRPLFW